jgi:tRNA (uracil-5-)-methyltransferase TRM9
METLRPRESDPVPGCDYETYFETGLYETRYPAPNAATLRTVRSLIGRRRCRVLDFGCGSGRYAAPLLEGTGAELVAYDTSQAALALLTRRLDGFVRSGRLLAVGGSVDALAAAVRRTGPVDLALFLFGVLGHVAGRSARIQLLRRVRELMRPDGYLVASVPNRWRRFLAEQARCQPFVGPAGLEPGDVLYVRAPADGPEIRMFYHLYTPADFESEIRAAGFRPVRFEPESILPENAVVRGRHLARVDRLLRHLVPAALGYGFLVVASVAADGSA